MNLTKSRFSLRCLTLTLFCVFTLSCDSTQESTKPTSKNLFKSERTAEESTIGSQTNSASQAVLVGSWVKPNDPVQVMRILNSLQHDLESDSGYPSSSTLAQVNNYLKVLPDFSKFLYQYEAGLENLEAVGAALFASQVLALLENSENASALALKTKFMTKWNTFAQVVKISSQWDSIQMPLFQPGSDCGEAPLAEGSLPSSDSGLAALDFAIETDNYIASNSKNIRFKNVSSAELEKFRILGGRLHRFVKREQIKKLNTQNYSPVKNYLNSVQSVLTSSLQQANPADLKKSLQSLILSQKTLTATFKTQLIEMSFVPAGVPSGTFLSEEGEDEFHFIANIPTQSDGRYPPWFASNPIAPPKSDPVVIGHSDVYTVIVDGTSKQAIFPIDFKMTSFSRKIDHIDYRLRREDQHSVLKSKRHVPNDTNKIALGQYFNFRGLRNKTGVEYFVVQAVPMDSANHPTPGACNYIKVRYRTQAEVDKETKSASESGTDFLGSMLLEDMDPMHRDSECESMEIGGYVPYDFPERTAWIEHSLAPAGFSVIPNDSVSVVNSGEIVQIVNNDSVSHRFTATDTSYFRAVTKVEGIPVSTGGYQFEVINSDKIPTGIKNDTGPIAPGQTVYLKLQTGLPMPYYFNLREAGAVGDSVYASQIHLYYYNVQCL